MPQTMLESPSVARKWRQLKSGRWIAVAIPVFASPDPRDEMFWTPEKPYVWERASFTVPADVSDERVQAKAAHYRNKLGNILESQGFRVLGIEGPTEDRTMLAHGITEPDRRRYVLRAKVTRCPQTMRISVPDDAVPDYEAAGAKLLD